MLKENEKVVRENNQLHQQLIEIKEQSQIIERDLSSNIGITQNSVKIKANLQRKDKHLDKYKYLTRLT